jgi:hypothetical protein
VKVFLDIDGVLLGPDRTRPSRLALADHACDFLAFALQHADLHWLTPHCRGDAAPAIQHLVRHAPASERERLLTLVARVRPTDFRTLRTEALPANGEPFVWIDDAPNEPELAWLRSHGLLDRWLWIDTHEEPEDLLRAQRWLAQKTGRAIGS